MKVLGALQRHQLPHPPCKNPGSATVQERVYQTPIHDVDDLKRRLIASWSGMQQSVIDNVIDQWRVRLWACVKANGRHFEHLL